MSAIFLHLFYAQFVSLIDGMINDCRSEVKQLTIELAESKEKLSWFETKLQVSDDVHFLEMSQSEAWISELERDLRKTASFFLKEKKTKGLELCRLQRQIQSKGG